MKMTLLCLLNTALLVTGQILFKVGSNGKQLSSIEDVIRMLFSPVILAALCLYAGTTVLWLYILSRTPMSHAYPIQALAYPVVLLLSMLLFKEPVSMTKWIGVAVIVFGVIIATRG